MLTFLFQGTGDSGYDGTAGNDTLIGGADADTLVGGDGSDTASYKDDTAGVTVNLSGAKVNEDGDTDSNASKNIYVKGSGGEAQNDLLTGIENLTGGAGNDTLTGDDSNNTLTGGAGNDTLTGGAGNDALNGGSGNDTLTGGAGKDTLTGGAGDDVFGVADSATSAALADIITDFTSGDKLAIGSVDKIFFANGANVATGSSTNDGTANDTVIYAANSAGTAADTSAVLAVLEDFSTDLTAADFNGTVTVAEIA